MKCHATRQDERGSAFLLALIVIVLLTILGVSIVLVTETEMALGHTEKTIDRQIYAAETGLWAHIAGLVLTNNWHHERVAVPIVPDSGRALPGKQLAYAINTTEALSLASGCPAWTDCGEDLPESDRFQSHFVLMASTTQRVGYDAAQPFDPDDIDTFKSPFDVSTVVADRLEDKRFAYIKGTGGQDAVQVLGQATIAVGFLVSPLRSSADTRRQEVDGIATDANSGFRQDPPPVTP
jgi:Tfp pilus assembly protein PilX